nr:hypothetical protein CFP56_02846 [Quercus suber]
MCATRTHEADQSISINASAFFPDRPPDQIAHPANGDVARLPRPQSLRALDRCLGVDSSARLIHLIHGRCSRKPPRKSVNGNVMADLAYL